MKKQVWLWLITLLLLVACKSGDKGSQALLLYQTLSEDDQPQELVVVNLQGEEQRRIPMTDFVRQAVAAQGGFKAMMNTVSGEYLVDAKNGTAQRLFSGDAFLRPLQFRGGGKRWMLAGSPQGDLTYLVDLETSQVHDMATLNEESEPVFYALFAPDEAHLVLGMGVDLWLVPTEDPGGARRLGNGKRSFASSFSSDGKQIAYVQRTEPGRFDLVLEAVDGSKSEVVASHDFIGWVAFVPKKDQLVFATRENVVLLSLDDGQEQTLLAVSGPTRRPWFAPDGKKLLLSEEADEGTIWHLIGLAGDVQTLDAVQGYTALLWNPDHRYLFFIDDPTLGEGGRRLVSLDLTSGATNPAMTVDAGSFYMGVVDLAADGKYGLVVARSGDEMQLWQIRADGGDPRLLAEADGVQGSFSPDGEWVAVSTSKRVDDRNERRVILMQTEGDETRAIGEGMRPFWVRP